jgi:hypothetical protein
MLCYEEYHIAHENRNFEIILLCLLPLHYVIWNYFLGKLNRQQKVFYIQKKIIRVMAGTKRRASCRELLKEFNILPLDSEFLLSLLSFVVNNLETFQTNSDIHNISTRYRHNLHAPNTDLSKY